MILQFAKSSQGKGVSPTNAQKNYADSVYSEWEDRSEQKHVAYSSTMRDAALEDALILGLVRFLGH